MWLAIETSGDLASVALGGPDGVDAEGQVEGARRHAAALLELINGLLIGLGTSQAEIEGVIVGDGPGGFTGLRIGATIAKALIRVRRRPLWRLASLKALAVARSPAEGSVVAALGDALRGEVYATVVRCSHAGIETMLAPSVWQPDQLSARIPRPDFLVIRPEGPRLIPPGWDGVPSKVAAPAAAGLLSLVGRAGGAQLIADPASWEPEYGRPAEAQAKWEASHGRRLPDSPGQLR